MEQDTFNLFTHGNSVHVSPNDPDYHEIEMRSDTFTKPTVEMRQAMFDAQVGDDVYREDPTMFSKKAFFF